MQRKAVIAEIDGVDWEGWPEELVAERGMAQWKTLFSSDVNGTAGIAAGLGRIDPGEELSEHRHPQHEAYFVTAGTATITVDGARHQVPAGGAIFIPGGLRHSCRNEGSEELRFVFCFPADSAGEIDYEF